MYLSLKKTLKSKSRRKRRIYWISTGTTETDKPPSSFICRLSTRLISLRFVVQIRERQRTLTPMYRKFLFMQSGGHDLSERHNLGGESGTRRCSQFACTRMSRSVRDEKASCCAAKKSRSPFAFNDSCQKSKSRTRDRE